MSCCPDTSLAPERGAAIWWIPPSAIYPEGQCFVEASCADCHNVSSETPVQPIPHLAAPVTRCGSQCRESLGGTKDRGEARPAKTHEQPACRASAFAAAALNR